ncbi:hypothetical protein KEM48_010889 [Puccinia striiformis f. sp. tritici PST-130]|nr:hypothetical protein KEM48_010889 [Puccinia striiformis f. sp. tritici PST-130]
MQNLHLDQKAHPNNRRNQSNLLCWEGPISPAPSAKDPQPAGSALKCESKRPGRNAFEGPKDCGTEPKSVTLLEEDELAKSNSGSDIEVMTEHVGVPDQVDTPSIKQSHDGSPARKYMCSPSTDSMGEVMSKLPFSRHKTIGGGSSNDSPPRKRPAGRVQPIPDPRSMKNQTPGRSRSLAVR